MEKAKSEQPHDDLVDDEDLAQNKPPKRAHALEKEDNEVLEDIEEHVATLREHQKCHLATSLPSRNALRVVTKDKQIKEFRVASINKILKAGRDDKRRSAIAEAGAFALEFLNATGGGAGSS